MGNYLYLPLIALTFHIFLFVAFFGYRKNELICSFLQILGANILWTAGSALMRLELGNSFAIWYHVSLAGILILPYVFWKFITNFLEAKKITAIQLIGLSVIPLYVINILTGMFLAPPTAVVDSMGRTNFVYAPTWAVVWLFVPTGITLIRIIYMCVVSYKENDEVKSKLAPILCGAAIVFVGNIIIMLPAFNGIPLDILSSNVFAFSLFYALYRKRLFKLSSVFSQSSCYLLAGAITILIFFISMKPMAAFMEKYLYAREITGSDNIMVICLFFVVMELVYLLIKKTLDGIFVKEEVKQNEILKNFSRSISKCLDKDTVLDELLSVVRDTLNVRKVYIFMPNTQDTQFEVVKNGSPLHENHPALERDNPLLKYLEGNRELVVIKDFKRTMAYRSLWEREKENISEYEYIAPLHDENELVGFVTLSHKTNKKDHYSVDDLSFLTSICSVASIGLKNAMMYERACIEAQTDELTGLINRKYFRKILDEQYEKCTNHALSLMIVNVDDFKLYNQLYGIGEGDNALIKIAQTIRSAVDESGYVARFSGKEFAVILPEQDVLATKALAEKIRAQIADINKTEADYRMKLLTVSIGICSIPYGAFNVKQLLENVDMTIYHVKRSGKNGIADYSEGIAESSNAESAEGNRENVYSSYASTIYALTAAIDTKDHYTFQHSENVAYYASELGYAYGLSEDNVGIIREAALLHDVGKIGIPEEILNKTGKLVDEEYEVMKGHVENAVGIIRHLPSLDYVVPAVIGHHERYDGSGYPRRIAGEDIPLFARILCIADSFDAITSRRSYKEAASVERALFIIEQELGKQFDPTLGELFIRCVKEGTIVPCAVKEVTH